MMKYVFLVQKLSTKAGARLYVGHSCGNGLIGHASLDHRTLSLVAGPASGFASKAKGPLQDTYHRFFHGFSRKR